MTQAEQIAKISTTVDHISESLDKYDKRNREDHGKLFEKLDSHSERLAKLETGSGMNTSWREWITRGAIAAGFSLVVYLLRG